MCISASFRLRDPKGDWEAGTLVAGKSGTTLKSKGTVRCMRYSSLSTVRAEFCAKVGSAGEYRDRIRAAAGAHGLQNIQSNHIDLICCVALHCIALHRITLHWIAAHCIAW